MTQKQKKALQRNRCKALLFLVRDQESTFAEISMHHTHMVVSRNPMQTLEHQGFPQLKNDSSVINICFPKRPEDDQRIFQAIFYIAPVEQIFCCRLKSIFCSPTRRAFQVPLLPGLYRTMPTKLTGTGPLTGPFTGPYAAFRN